MVAIRKLQCRVMQGLSKVHRLGHCLNQDLQGLRISKMEIPNPVNPFILIILIGLTHFNPVIPAKAGIQRANCV